MKNYTGVSISPPAWYRHAFLVVLILSSFAAHAQKKVTGKVIEEAAKHDYFPVPQAELNANPAMVQNQYWK